MPLTTYPLNNIDYDASDAETYMSTRTSGIFAKNDFPYTVTGTDTNITIGSGLAWIHNHQFAGKSVQNATEAVVNCGQSDAQYPRYDVVTLRYSKINNETTLVCKHGTPASSPQYPEITQTVAEYELYLYAVYRPAGATVITAANITDLRLSKYCGLMADSVTQIDTSAIEAQVQALLDGLISNTDVMLKSVYDTNNDGTVGKADNANNATNDSKGNKIDVKALQDSISALQNSINALRTRVSNLEKRQNVSVSVSGNTLRING